MASLACPPTLDAASCARLRPACSPCRGAQDKARTQLTLEHVLPQKMAEGSGWAAAFPPEQHAHWVHRLGNLVLLASRKNAAAGMLPFQDKKKKYFFSGGANVSAGIPLTDSVNNSGEGCVKAAGGASAPRVGGCCCICTPWQLKPSPLPSFCLQRSGP